MSKDKMKFPKSVSFNLKNMNDVAILEFVKKRNFSGYVKNLILKDMKEKGVSISVEKTTKPLSKFEQFRQELKIVTNNFHDCSDKESNSKGDW